VSSRRQSELARRATSLGMQRGCVVFHADSEGAIKPPIPPRLTRGCTSFLSPMCGVPSPGLMRIAITLPRTDLSWRASA
jgi:hypothetical protein